MNTRDILQAQIDSLGVGNPNGHPMWRLDYVRGQPDCVRSTSFSASRRYHTPTWGQLVQAVKRRYKVNW